MKPMELATGRKYELSDAQRRALKPLIDFARKRAAEASRAQAESEEAQEMVHGAVTAILHSELGEDELEHGWGFDHERGVAFEMDTNKMQRLLGEPDGPASEAAD